MPNSNTSALEKTTEFVTCYEKIKKIQSTEKEIDDLKKTLITKELELKNDKSNLSGDITEALMSTSSDNLKTFLLSNDFSVEQIKISGVKDYSDYIGKMMAGFVTGAKEVAIVQLPKIYKKRSDFKKFDGELLEFMKKFNATYVYIEDNYIPIISIRKEE